MADPTTIAAAATVLSAGVGIAAATKKPPKPKEIQQMPTTDNEAILRARRAQAEELANRGGRASTILTDTTNTLGG